MTGEDVLSGTAAVGLPIANALIGVKGRNGALKTTTTDVDGKYRLNVAELTRPYLLKVDRPSGESLYSVGSVAGTVNIHPLTDLIIQIWYEAQGKTIEAAFADPIGNPPPASEEVKVISDMVQHLMQSSLQSNGLDLITFNIITSPFNANNTGFDKVLESTKVSAGIGGSFVVTTTDSATETLLSTTLTPAIGAATLVTTSTVGLGLTATSTTTSTNVVVAPVGNSSPPMPLNPIPSVTGLTFNNSPKIGQCSVFSDQYLFNQQIDNTQFAVLPNSSTMIKNVGLHNFNPSISTQAPLVSIVQDQQPLLPLGCDPFISWCTRTLIGKGVMVPYPPDLFIVPGHDHHAFVIQETVGGPAGGVATPNPLLPISGGKNCFLYETWWTGRIVNNASPTSQPITSYTPGSNVTGFTGGGFSVFDMKRDVNYTPKGVGGSSASNLPLVAGIVRYDEAKSDTIRHALSTAVPLPRYGYILPANTGQLPLNCAGAPTNQTPKALQNFADIKKFPCDLYNVNLPAMGQRFRLKVSFNETPYLAFPISLAIIHALKKYGTIITDGSGGSFMWHADSDPRWQQHLFPDIQQLKNLKQTDFEAIQSGPVIDMPAPKNTKNFPGSSMYN